MSYIATDTLSEDMGVALMSEVLVLETPANVFPKYKLELNKQETLNLRDFLNRSI